MPSMPGESPHKWFVALAVMVAAVAWNVVIEILRHRSYLKHRGSGFVPSTQHLVMLSAVGTFVLIVVAVTVMIFG